jgi:hypothetical protein
MSGSPIIIYPTGRYNQNPYILGIHVEGTDETTFKIEANYFEEKYNYGNKIIRDLLFNKYHLYVKEIMAKNIKLNEK